MKKQELIKRLNEKFSDDQIISIKDIKPLLSSRSKKDLIKDLFAKGCTNVEISDIAGVSRITVAREFQKLKQQYNIKTRMQLIKVLLQEGGEGAPKNIDNVKITSSQRSMLMEFIKCDDIKQITEAFGMSSTSTYAFLREMQNKYKQGNLQKLYSYLLYNREDI